MRSHIMLLAKRFELLQEQTAGDELLGEKQGKPRLETLQAALLKTLQKEQEMSAKRRLLIEKKKEIRETELMLKVIIIDTHLKNKSLYFFKKKS